MADRVPLLAYLPADMEPHARQAIETAFQEHAKQINIGASIGVSTVGGNSTVNAEVMLVSAGASAVRCTLLKANQWIDRVLTVKKIDVGAGPVLIAPQTGETIDGASTTTISVQWASISLVSNGISYFKI